MADAPQTTMVDAPLVVALYLCAPIGAKEGKNVPAGIKGEWVLSINYA
ncbi:hypothetical protein [Paraburkholderia kirstenboschensis]|nr:hypothetical protein [Paraburkholderia kirstenboschensis]